jgi:hypothetical protein
MTLLLTFIGLLVAFLVVHALSVLCYGASPRRRVDARLKHYVQRHD